MEYLGFFGILAFIWCLTLSGKVKRLEQIIKANGLSTPQTESLRNMLEKYMGQTVELSLHKESIALDFGSKECLIEDIDEDWVLVKINPSKKNETQKLIRIDLIKDITIK